MEEVKFFLGQDPAKIVEQYLDIDIDFLNALGTIFDLFTKEHEYAYDRELKYMKRLSENKELVSILESKVGKKLIGQKLFDVFNDVLEEMPVVVDTIKKIDLIYEPQNRYLIDTQIVTIRPHNKKYFTGIDFIDGIRIFYDRWKELIHIGANREYVSYIPVNWRIVNVGKITKGSLPIYLEISGIYEDFDSNIGNEKKRQQRMRNLQEEE